MEAKRLQAFAQCESLEYPRREYVVSNPCLVVVETQISHNKIGPLAPKLPVNVRTPDIAATWDQIEDPLQ